MAVPTIRVSDQSLDIVAATPVQYDFPLKSENEVEVIYGKANVTAVLNADYEVTIAADYLSFTITPTAALIAKIDALIGLDATEVNYITVRRTQSPLTEANVNDIRRAEFLLNEIERLHMHVSEIWETLWRTLMFKRKNVGTPQNAAYADDLTTAGATLVVNATADGVEEGPTVAEVEGWKDDAEAAAAAAETFKNTAAAQADISTAQAAISTTKATEAAASAALALGYTMTLSVIAVDQVGVVNKGFVANKAGLLTLTLPAASALGDSLQIIGQGAGGWRIAQGAGQSIRFAGLITTAGAGGHIDSTNQYDVMTLRCVVANTIWQVVNSVGNFEVT
jgi:hypothetical protein